MICGRCAYPMRDFNYWHCMAPMRVGDKNREKEVTPKTECFNNMFVAKPPKKRQEPTQ